MKHLSEDDLVLYYYGERVPGVPAEEHLGSCAACRTNLESLRQTLDAMNSLAVPEPAENYETRMWQRVYPAIEAIEIRRRRWFDWMFGQRKWVLAGAMALIVIGAFMAGRISQKSQLKVVSLSGQVRERILMVAVGEHLERSQMILIELANNETKGPVDISEQQVRAEDLVNENRLYRQAALKSGDKSVSNLLDELERVLLDIAHGPSKLDSAEFDDIRRRIEAEGILFKIRVVGSNLKARERVRVRQGQSKSL